MARRDDKADLRVNSMSDKNYILNGAVLTRVFDDGTDVFEVPNGVRVIGEDAFRETNFKRVILPKSVAKIEKNAFRCCKNLEEINLKYIYKFGYAAFAESGIKAAELHAPVIPDMLFRRCTALSRVELVGTRKIGDSAFERTGALTELALPETLVKIGRFAFTASGIKCIRLPRGILSIGSGAFAGCVSVCVYSKTSTVNYWGTAISIAEAFVEILNENDGTHEYFFFYPEIFESIKGCFQNGKFDIDAYDKTIFHLEDMNDVNDRIYAMMVRLPGINKRHNSRLQEYYFAFLDYIDAHSPLSAMALLDYNKEMFLQWLELAVDEQTFPELLDYAVKKGDPEIIAAILKYKNEHFPDLNDNLDLE